MSEDGLDVLVRRLTNQEMPIFARSMKQIVGIAGRDDSSVLELAQVILRDASLTARLLKIANSSYYNPGHHRITTISRALVVLGLDKLRNMCLSIAMVETALKGKARERLSREMAHAFHAAVQASKFASMCSSKSGSEEEVFIAALLFRLGHIAFWCYGEELADRLEEAMRNPEMSPVKAEQEVLGFRIQQLTMRLSKEWHLSELLDLTLGGTALSDPRVRSITLGYKLVQSLERGWGAPEVVKVIEDVARLVKLPSEEAAKIIQQSTKEAALIAESFGIGSLGGLIQPPSPSDKRGAEGVALMEEPGESKDIVKEAKPFPEPDPMLQLSILKDLSNLLLERQLDINLLFSMLLEGIFRGIGMDRVVFAMLTPDRRDLKVKHGVGWTDLSKLIACKFDVTRGENIFSHVLKVKKPLWVKADAPMELAGLLTGTVAEWVRTPPFFVMPIVLKGQGIGVIYADRQESGRELDEECFSSFSTFGNQASLCLTSLVQ